MFLLLSVLAAPSHAAEFSVIGSLVREHHVDPGARAEGTITVRNDGDTTARLVVSLRDFHFDADGTNDYADPMSLPRSNAGWVRFSPSQITLEPDESEQVHFRVEVPPDETLAGTYWSLLMVEPAVPEPVVSVAIEPKSR